MTRQEAVLDNLFSRRSVRSFENRSVDPADLRTLVKAGQYAPSGLNKQDVCFLVTDRPELIRELSALNANVMRKANPDYKGDPFYGAPALIAVLADESDPNAVKNGSVAMENIMLAAHALDLGTCWINRADAVFESEQGKELKKSLNIPEHYQGVGFVIVGYPASVPEAKERTSLVVEAL